MVVVVVVVVVAVVWCIFTLIIVRAIALLKQAIKVRIIVWVVVVVMRR